MAQYIHSIIKFEARFGDDSNYFQKLLCNHKLLHPIVNTMVTEMCEMAKSEMKTHEKLCCVAVKLNKFILNIFGKLLTKVFLGNNARFTKKFLKLQQ